MMVLRIVVWMLSVCAAGGQIDMPLPPEDYVFNDDFYSVGLESDYCADKFTCSPDNDLSFPDKNCYCDKLCVLRKDCCSNYEPPNDPYLDVLAEKKMEFTCVRRPEISKHPLYGVSMVTSCAMTWNDGMVRQDCELNNETDILSNVPVSNIKTKVMYKNMFCAYCNYEYDFLFWKAEAKCNRTFVNVNEIDQEDSEASDVDMSSCDFIFTTPSVTISPVDCQYGDVIDSCLDVESNGTFCQDGPLALVYNEASGVYKNKHCAICNNVPVFDLKCEAPPMTSPPIMETDKKTYSFRFLVDFNIGRTDVNNEPLTYHNCSNDQMYDPILRYCRKIHCPHPTLPEHGKCVLPKLTNIYENFTLPQQPMNCTFAKFNVSELKFTNKSTVTVLATNAEFALDDVLINEDGVYICLYDIITCKTDCTRKDVYLPYDDVEGLLSLIGLVLSLIALAVAITIYAVFSQLRNTPGKILLSLMVSLFCAQLLFLVAYEVQDESKWCQVIAILVHYGFLSAFCWMNVIALDLWMTFSKQFMAPGAGGKTPKRWYFYNIYGWLVPLIIVVAAVVIDNVHVSESMASFQPRYGQGICWFNSRNGLILFFAGPLAVFKMFDVISFISTAMHIVKAKRQGAMAREKKKTCSFLINLKLSLVMGLTWVFAFVANLANVPTLWYLFIIFNTLQGLFICISFVFTKKVFRLVSEKYSELSSGAGTQQTSISQTKDNRSGNQ